MTNLGILIKKDFSILIGKLRGKKKQKSTAFATKLLILGAILLLAYYSYTAWIMYDGLGVWAEGKLCVFHACTTSVAVLIILGMMRSSSKKKTSDADLLLSMPIKKRDIVISKTLSRYFFDLFFVVMLFLPFVVIYQIKIALNLRLLLFGILLTFILPGLSIGLSYIFDFLVSRLFNKIRIGEMLKSIFLVFVFIAVLGLLLVKTSTYGMITSLDGYFEERPLSNVLLKVMYGGGWINYVWLACMTIAPFVIGLFLYTFDFGKPVIAYVSKDKKLHCGKLKSPVHLLLKKELYYYATTTGYIINTIIGAVIMLIIGVFVSIKGQAGLSSLIGVEIPNSFLVGILVLILCGSSATTYISASSISLEGKCISLIKSMPLKPGTIFLTKSLLHIVIVEPFLILSSVLMWIFLKLSFVHFLILFIIPTLHVLIMAFGGTLLNLWQPNFDWEDETKVVKNSLASLLAMVLGFLLMVALIVIYKLLDNISVELLALICGGVYAIILVVILLVLFIHGRKMFEKL